MMRQETRAFRGFVAANSAFWIVLALAEHDLAGNNAG